MSLKELSKKTIDSIGMTKLDIMEYHAALQKRNDSGQLVTEEALSILDDMQEVFERLHGCMRDK